MKLVLAVYNSKYIHSSLAPWCLAAGLQQYAPWVEYTVQEGTINQPPELLVNKILQQKPDVVGFAVYIWNRTQTIQAVQQLRQATPDCKIILGGPEVSYNAAQVLNEIPQVDYILSGEGEESLPALCNAIKDGVELHTAGIEGLCVRTENGVQIAEPAILHNPPPDPYTEDYFAALQGRICYIETTRGCPYRCAFCLSGRCGPVRCFELEEMKRRITKLANSGTKTIKFVDRTFNAHPARAAEIWRWIAEEYGKTLPTDVCFHFEVAGDILNEEHFQLLNEMPDGAVQLEIGLQSFHEPTLAAIHRKTNCKKLAENIRRLAQPQNIHLHIDLIAGLPLETYDIFANSFDIAFSLAPQMLQLGFLKLLHGADMRELPAEYPCRFEEEPPYQVIDTPWISQQELQKLHKIEDVVEKTYNSGRFRKTVEYLLQTCGYTPFRMFEQLSECEVAQKIGLDDYTALLFEQALKLPKIQPEQLRDVMCIDRMESNGTGKLPCCLQREDKQLKAYKTALNALYPQPQNAKRGVAELYARQELMWVDYNQPAHPVTGRRKAKFIPLKELCRKAEESET